MDDFLSRAKWAVIWCEFSVFLSIARNQNVPLASYPRHFLFRVSFLRDQIKKNGLFTQSTLFPDEV